MNVKDAMKHSLKSTQNMLEMYLSDLSDADLLVRPVPGANHLAWQLGHLISSEVMMVKSQLPEARYPALPAGFDAVHATAAVANNGPDGFLSREQYRSLFDEVRSATMAVAEGLTDAELDRAAPRNRAQ